MSFGLCNVPETFQCLMNKVFEPFLDFFLRIFIDDFEVYNDRDSHLTKLELIFQCLDGLKVTLNLETTTIGFSKGNTVGHIVSKDGVTTYPKKFDRISKFPFPTTKKAFRNILGMVGYIEYSYTCLWQKHVF